MRDKIPNCLENLLLDNCITDLHVTMTSNSLVQEDAYYNFCAIEADCLPNMCNKLLYDINRAASWTKKVSLEDEETG